MHIDPDTNQLQVWFPYTTDLVQKVKKGAFIAVKNFDSTAEEGDTFTLLEIMEALPTHYALGSSKNAIEKTFPGFMEEAAKNAKTDWEQDEPTERTTYIKCTCEKAGKAISFDETGEARIKDNNALPMVGEDAKILSNEMIAAVINEDLGKGERTTISPAHLQLDEDIPFELEVEGLLKTHFGIFGFTGAGKSNLMSNIIGKILESDSNASIVFSDLMGEYLVLLLDLIAETEDAFVVCLDEDSIPGGEDTVEYLKNGNSIDDAVDSIANTLIIPRELSEDKEKFKPVIKKILEEDKIRTPTTDKLTGKLIFDEFDSITDDNPPTALQYVDLRLQEVFDEEEEVQESDLSELISKLQVATESREVPEEPTNWELEGGNGQNSSLDTFDSTTTSDTETGSKDISFASSTTNLTKSQRPILFDFMNFLQDITRELRGEGISPISRNKMIDILDKQDSSLIVLTSDKASDLKSETGRLMRRKYNQRKRQGNKDPLVSFIFDEADEYIPNNASDDGTKRVKAEIEEIARRGRKFGIGIGLATQRSTYLDTNIMAQPHTYMISKLPRETDRETVGEAFGISEEVLDKTLDFNTGEWLSVSFEAMGLSGFPIPAKFDNANKRIKKYIEDE